MSEPKYRTTKHFSNNLLATEMKRTHILMNNPVFLGLSILEIRKIVMYEFWYDYVKPKYEEKVELCYINTVTFIVYIKADNIYVEITKDL